MKWFLWILIFLVFVTPIIFIGKGIDHLSLMKDRYKRAVDAGVDAAVKYSCYRESEDIAKAAIGYGTGLDDRRNLAVNKVAMLEWFYIVLFRNLGMENSKEAQLELKQYIPMKAIVSFDRLIIADARDAWVSETPYYIEYKGKNYGFTLSKQVLDVSTNKWLEDNEIGITPDQRKLLISDFIKEKLNHFLNTREGFESGFYYDVNISLSDIDAKSDDIDGINFIVLIEGLPLPSLNPWKHNKLYAFSLGGSELSR